MLNADNTSRIKSWWHWRTACTNLFIAFFIYNSVVHLLPYGVARNSLLQPIKPVVEGSGLWHNFRTFSPQPPQSNQYLSALISFDDGTSSLWQYPDLEHFDSLLAWAQADRYRIFWTHYLHSRKALYPDFASYLGSQLIAGNKRPSALRLVRRTVYTALLNPVNGKIERQPLSRQDTLYECTFAFQPQKLAVPK